jgi:hypothetical protein
MKLQVEDKKALFEDTYHPVKDRMNKFPNEITLLISKSQCNNELAMQISVLPQIE